ncbi:MAG TPA: acyl-CoA thioesterase [Candidatus Poseidoniales archaeon]|jgi:acyl-CoA hydrolase|nr:MAG: acyl-CoA thioesterase [Euryarchaeota archaeon]HIG04107.1 acyl-CoA thioesterase [Candidatus Poseidoniales archaeon]HIK78690.1 acyl-CoA thioesterase [Candidatus Poseidoniales archaeon]
MAMDYFSREPVTLAEEVFPGDTNAYGTLFGGRLMGLMDKAAGFSASKYAHREFVTASVDTLEFINPARQGDIIEVVGRVVFTSTHTAACKVNAYALSKSDWERKDICSGYFFMVAIDANGRPVPIPQFEPSTTEEKKEWELVATIRQHLLEHRHSKND